MPGLGAGVADVRGAGTDPMSAVAHSQVTDGISRMGDKGIPLARSCIGYIRAQQSSNGQVSSTVENSSMKSWCFHSSSAILSQSNAAMLFKLACCRDSGCTSECHALALVCHTSASACHASASASWASFWHVANSAFKPNSQ